VARANHPGRFLALVFDVDGRPTAFVKVARDTFGALALSREREAIEGLGAQVPPPLTAPKLLMHSEGVLAVEAFDWRTRRSPWQLPEDVAFALGMFFRRTSDAAGTSGAAHGDFAPWNLLRTENGWGLVDWESFHTGAPPYFDLFHYMTQSRSELRRPRIRTILEGLNGKGWVGAAIGAYAAGSEVDAHHSAHFLREYLRISRANLDQDAPPRGVRVRSRMSSRLSR
jgi:hypothetical protein